MTVLETFLKVAREPAQVAREWKAKGGKVVGYRCLYIPEEIIWAADALPYPLYGTPEPVVMSDSYFQSCTCEFVRNLFDHALTGRLDFLDGLALSNTCDIVRRLYDMWGTYIETSPVYILNNPQKLLTEANREYWLEEHRRFKVWIEELTGVDVTDEKLRTAIELHNETRALLRELYDMRRGDTAPLTGAEALQVCNAVTVLPKDQANRMLKELIPELRAREKEERDGPRILVMGSVIDSPDLVRMIEEEGGQVVVEDLCNTSRYFWHRVETQGDPMEALYAFMNQRPLCACMHPTEARYEYLTELVDAFDVEAVINFNLKYCHPFLYEAPLFKEALEARDIPTNVLEVGHDRSGHGQLRTRIQAFIEMLEIE